MMQARKTREEERSRMREPRIQTEPTRQLLRWSTRHVYAQIVHRGSIESIIISRRSDGQCTRDWSAWRLSEISRAEIKRNAREGRFFIIPRVLLGSELRRYVNFLVFAGTVRCHVITLYYSALFARSRARARTIRSAIDRTGDLASQ